VTVIMDTGDVPKITIFVSRPKAALMLQCCVRLSVVCDVMYCG